MLGEALKGARHSLTAPCAQVKASLLLAGTMAIGETSVSEPLPSDERLEWLLSLFGAEMRREGLLTALRGGLNLAGQRLAVPPDLSWAASQAHGTSRLRGALKDGPRQAGRLVGLLKGFGVKAEAEGEDLVVSGPARLTPGRIGAGEDEQMARAGLLAGLLADGETEVSQTRVISDRYPGLLRELSRLRG